MSLTSSIKTLVQTLRELSAKQEEKIAILTKNAAQLEIVNTELSEYKSIVDETVADMQAERAEHVRNIAELTAAVGRLGDSIVLLQSQNTALMNEHEELNKLVADEWSIVTPTAKQSSK
jgi:chromosome segregation ATPase